MSEHSEHWLPVPDWEFYEVSDLGRVRSLPRPTARGVRGGRVLKPWINDGGYEAVGLSCRSRQVHVQVHQLVAAAFIGPCPPGMEVRHGPGGKLDNRATELCYGTRSENVRDRTRDGQDNRGERCGQAKLTAEIVADIRRRVAAGESQRAVSRRFGVTYQNVSMIITGKTWAYTDGPVQALHGQGEGNSMAKLTWEKVGEIRRRYAAGVMQDVLAREYDVSNSNIRLVVTGKTWKNRTY